MYGEVKNNKFEVYEMQTTVLLRRALQVFNLLICPHVSRLRFARSSQQVFKPQLYTHTVVQFITMTSGQLLYILSLEFKESC